MRVTNRIPLGCPLFSPLHTVNGVQTLKVNRRAIRELLKLVDTSTDLEVAMEASIMEVYNENLYDLLSRDREKLTIRQSPSGVFVENLKSRPVETQQDLDEIIAEGDRNRTTACTQMNTSSSRSHLILQLDVEAYNKISRVTNRGRLTLVDLAGSERVGKTGVRCAFSDRNLHSGMPLVPTPARLKRTRV